VLIAIVVLVLAGGGAAFVFLVLVKPTPESTFNEMRSAACAGDVSGFFAHIDKTQVGRGLSDMAIDEARSKGGSLGAKLAEGMVDRAIQAAITEWEDDIKKREDGNLCKMQFVSADKNVQHSGWVRWRTPSGVNKTWKFERYGDKWLVTAMR
jgi:hypothetical protein